MLNAYFSKENGIGYSLIRTNIHSCDFSSGSYTYIEEGDTALKTFTINHDKQFRIPLIKAATKTVGGKITLYASPWSPPAFMKDNNNMLKGGKLLPQYYQSWANYYVKFINSYKKEGIPVWGLNFERPLLCVVSWLFVQSKTPTNELSTLIFASINPGNAQNNPNYQSRFQKTMPMNIYIPPAIYTTPLLQDSGVSTSVSV